MLRIGKFFNFLFVYKAFFLFISFAVLKSKLNKERKHSYKMYIICLLLELIHYLNN